MALKPLNPLTLVRSLVAAQVASRRTHFGRKLIIVTAAVALVATSCSGNEPDDEPEQGQQISNVQGVVTNAMIETVGDCDVLLDKIKVEALERVGPFGLNTNNGVRAFGVGGFDNGDDAVAETFDVMPDQAPQPQPRQLNRNEKTADVPVAAADVAEGASRTQSDSVGEVQAPADPQSKASPGTGSAEQQYSETNNQEQNVDEPDLVKTDGKRLITVRGNKLYVVDVEAAKPKLTKTIHLPEEVSGGELFLAGDSALLMTNGWTPEPFYFAGEQSADAEVAPNRSDASEKPANFEPVPDTVSEIIVEDGPVSDEGLPLRELVDSRISWPGSRTGRILEIDLKQAEVGRVLEFEGTYVSAREVDGSIRVVLSAAESRFPFVTPSNAKASETAENTNRELIENSTIEQWLPTYRITDGDEVVNSGQLVDCDRVHLPKEFAGFGSLVVLTADLDDGLKLTDSLSVFTDANTVYSSTDRLVVAAPRWPELATGDDEVAASDESKYRTMFHSFDIGKKDVTKYSASGSVKGYLLSQFSMSEHEGNFRVATTTATKADNERSTTESFVTVLQEDGEELIEVGQVGNIGKGEDIKSVRFFGDVGYVVTFRQIDPFFTIDLSDPTAPAVMGELKIPGFSSYLHPVGENFVVGVGPDGNLDGRGGTFGVVASLIDVSDLSNPERVDKLSLTPRNSRNGGFGAYTPVSDDAKAFTFWQPTSSAIVPVRYGNGQSDAVVVEVDTDKAQLDEVGRVDQALGQVCPQYDFDEPTQMTLSRTTTETDTSGGSSAVDQLNDGLSNSADANLRGMPSPDSVEANTIPVEPGLEYEFCEQYMDQINRTVIVGDNLLTFSDQGIGVHNFDTLKDVSWIELGN